MTYLNINGLNYDLQPIYLGNQKKKELKGNDYLKLYGALMILLENNEDNLKELTSDSPYDFYKRATIQDDELYLENFEGIELFDLNHQLNIRTLYLNENNQVVISVYDGKFDKYFDFIA